MARNSQGAPAPKLKRGSTSEVASPDWNAPAAPQRVIPPGKGGAATGRFQARVPNPPIDEIPHMNISPILAQCARLDRMTTALIEMKEILDAALQDMEKTPDAIMAHITRYVHLRDSYKALDDARKEIGKQVEVLNNTIIPDLLRGHGVSSMNMPELGVRVGMSSRWSASMPDKEAGMEWLRKNGHPDIIQETVNASTLAALAKELVEVEGRDLPEEFFKVSMSTTTSVTKLTKK